MIEWHCTFVSLALFLEGIFSKQSVTWLWQKFIQSLMFLKHGCSAVSFAYGFRIPSPVLSALFLFSKGGRKQNAGSLLTTYLDTVFHGSFLSTFWLIKLLQTPIGFFEICGCWSYHGKQNECYHVKEYKELYQKQVLNVTTHFFKSPIEKTNSDLVFMHPKPKQNCRLKLQPNKCSEPQTYHSKWGC